MADTMRRSETGVLFDPITQYRPAADVDGSQAGAQIADVLAGGSGTANHEYCVQYGVTDQQTDPQVGGGYGDPETGLDAYSSAADGFPTSDAGQEPSEPGTTALTMERVADYILGHGGALSVDWGSVTDYGPVYAGCRLAMDSALYAADGCSQRLSQVMSNVRYDTSKQRDPRYKGSNTADEGLVAQFSTYGEQALGAVVVGTAEALPWARFTAHEIRVVLQGLAGSKVLKDKHMLERYQRLNTALRQASSPSGDQSASLLLHEVRRKPQQISGQGPVFAHPDAACRPAASHDQTALVNHVGTFFVKQGQSTKPAKASCNGCLAQAPCLEFALEHNIEHGMWGGQAVGSRQKIKTHRNKSAGQS